MSVPIGFTVLIALMSALVGGWIGFRLAVAHKHTRNRMMVRNLLLEVGKALEVLVSKQKAFDGPDDQLKQLEECEVRLRRFLEIIANTEQEREQKAFETRWQHKRAIPYSEHLRHLREITRSLNSVGARMISQAKQLRKRMSLQRRDAQRPSN